jgi:drug/metabolite transporter (DMT)-like permease
MPTTAIVALLSLAAAASWGAADFSGGLASKKSDVYGVVLIAHAVGFIFTIAIALLWHDLWPGWQAIVWGLAAGIFGGVGLAALYRSLAIGTMGINAPVASVVTGLLPVAFTFLTLGLPSRSQLAGFSLALVAIWLISMPPNGLVRPQGLGLAVLAGFGFSGFLVCIKLAGTTARFWPLVSARASSLLLMVLIVSAIRDSWKPPRSATGPVIFCGIFDSIGNFFFVYAATRGRLDVAAVLSSLYPASTLILARVFLKERIAKLQTLGIALAFASVVLIAM